MIKAWGEPTMTQQEKEYQEFIVKFTKLSKEFYDEFGKLSSENKQRFQNGVAFYKPFEWASFQKFLNAKF